MPPRYSYWTILAGGLPTAFRAALREELMPTFQRLRSKHPDAEMKWFQRGRLWDSQEAAQVDARQTAVREDVRAGRGRDWRPGGDHRDPKQKYKDAKKARNLDRRHDRFERRQNAAGPNRGSTGPSRPPKRVTNSAPGDPATPKPEGKQTRGRQAPRRR